MQIWFTFCKYYNNTVDILPDFGTNKPKLKVNTSRLVNLFVFTNYIKSGHGSYL